MLFCIPITLLSSDKKRNDLYNNGPLGRGFVKKSKEALYRERILAGTRTTNHQTQLHSDQESAESAWDCVSGICAIAFVTVTIMQSLCMNLSETWNYDNDFNLMPSKKASSSHAFICSPVIESIILTPPNVATCLGGTIQFRSKLHHLREKFDALHKTQQDELSYFPCDKNSEFFGVTKYLIQHPSGIMAKYTDGQRVRVSYDQQRNCFEYSVKKKR